MSISTISPNSSKYDNQKTDIEFRKCYKKLYKKYKTVFKVIISLLLIILIFPIIWSNKVLPFYCNDSMLYSFIELLLIIFVWIIPSALLEIYFIAWKLSNCEAYRNVN